MRPRSRPAAGASRSSNAKRARDASGSAAMLTMTAARAEAHRALRIEPEDDRLAHSEIGEAAGLRQRDPDLGARLLLAHQHRRIRAVEEQALDATGKSLRVGRQ